MSLVITSGYGSNQLLPTSGYGGSSISGTVFRLDSAELPSDNVVRARLTRRPKTSGPETAQRADIVANWTLEGPNGAVAIQLATPFIDDDEVIDLLLFADLVPGDYVLTISSDVITDDSPGQPLQAPYSVAFTLSEVAQDPISGGATNSPQTAGGVGGGTCEDDVTRLFNPAFRQKKNWSAIISGVATGDCIVREQAAKSLAQLYVTTASGAFLRKRAADRGIKHPTRLGMTDDLFRSLVVTVTNQKLTQQAFLSTLAIFYGEDAVRAHLETQLSEPFVLFDGAGLRLLVDERITVDVEFLRADFTIFRRAKAIEVAAAITRAMEQSGCGGYALAVVDATTGRSSVKIYSGTRGLGSSIRVLNGAANISLQLPQTLFPEPSTPYTLPVWVVEPLSDGKARYHCGSDSLYDLADVVEGDYIVVVGGEFNAGNRGSFVVESTHYSYGGSGVEQWVEVTNPTASVQAVNQGDFDSLAIFRPKRATLYDAPSYAVVSQYDGISRVSIAATTQAVKRTTLTAAYLQTPEVFDVSALTRDVSGAVTVTTATPHGISPGQQFILDDVIPGITAPGQTPGSPSTGFSSFNEAQGTSVLSAATTWNTDFTFEGADFKTIRDFDGDLWVWGGNRYSDTGTPTAIDSVSIFRVDDFNTDVSGQKSYDYHWLKGDIGVTYNLGAALAVLDGANRNQVRAAGGYLNTPWGGPTAADVMETDVATADKAELRQPVLVLEQLSNTEGVLAATALWLTAEPASGAVLTVSDGTTTRNYGFGVGGDVTVALGGTPAVTMVNLAAAITADGSADWAATYAVGLTSFPNPAAVVIFEDAVIASKSGLRMWGDAATSAASQVVEFADNFQADADYSSGVAATMPLADPGFGRAGIHRAATELLTGDIHEILDGQEFRSWTGAAWSSTIPWVLISADGVLDTGVAEATATWLGTPTNQVVVCGGVTAINKATDIIQEGLSGAYTSTQVLKVPRCQHQALALDATRVLVVGGRQPADDAIRISQGFTSWGFDDLFTATDYAGPVDISTVGSARLAGKIGHGIEVTAAMACLSGVDQTALNTDLLGEYTVAGWMTAAPGCVIKNGVDVWVDAADNTLLAFGVDGSDHFYIRWQAGVTTYTKTTTETRAELMGTHRGAPYPRYHHFAITKTDGVGVSTFTLFINGTEIESWTDISPDGGADGVWGFGRADGAEPGFRGCVDEIGISATVLTAEEVRVQYLSEVGVVVESPRAALESPVGRVLNSCEIVTSGGASALTGPMSDARFAFGMVALPDGRIIVAGGCGYNPSTDEIPHNKAQREIELRSAEVYNPDLRCWTPLPQMRDPHSYPAIAYIESEQRVYIAGGFSSRALEYLDLTTMIWHVSTETFSDIRAHGGGGLAGTGVIALPGGADYNTDGADPLYDTDSIGATSYHAAAAAETRVAGGLNAWHRAAAGSTGTTLKFQTPRHPHWTTAISGEVMAARAPAAAHPGPYIFDRKNGFGVGAVSAELLIGVAAGKKYATLEVDDTSAFGSSGYLVLNWGRANEVGPVRYLGLRGGTTLALDASWTFPKTVEAGATVHLVTPRAPWVPEQPQSLGAFYLTASNAGRAGAQEMLREISASGIELEVTVRYPGDRGLGGARYPTNRNYKLSDIVTVFGDDDIDRELEALRGT